MAARLKKLDVEMVRADEVVAKRVIVEDGKGPRIALNAVQGRANIILFNRKRQPRMNLSVDSDGRGCLNFFDRKGKGRLDIMIAGDNPTIILADGIGQERLMFTVRKAGHGSVYDVPLIWVLDIDGKIVRDLATLGGKLPPGGKGKKNR